MQLAARCLQPGACRYLHTRPLTARCLQPGTRTQGRSQPGACSHAHKAGGCPCTAHGAHQVTDTSCTHTAHGAHRVTHKIHTHTQAHTQHMAHTDLQTRCTNTHAKSLRNTGLHTADRSSRCMTSHKHTHTDPMTTLYSLQPVARSLFQTACCRQDAQGPATTTLQHPLCSTFPRP